jgi:monoterpene epsilon-lactone hydrolase
VPSLQHQLLARVVPTFRRSHEVTDPEVERHEILVAHATARTDPPPRLVKDFDLATDEQYGFPVHDLRIAGTRPQRTLLYLHGGGYVGHADRIHWRYAVRLARRLGARVVLPVYPLAPEFTWRDAHGPLLALFEQVAITSPQGVVLAGDSAGGGLALALAEQTARRSGPQPTHLVLHSPWLDLTGTLSARAPSAHLHDERVRLSRMRLWATWWAGGDDETRPELSPLFGDLTGLPPALMFCGTRDAFHLPCRDLVDRARQADWDLTYVEEPDLLHVYPLLPVPEAHPAFARTVGFLDGNAAG